MIHELLVIGGGGSVGSTCFEVCSRNFNHIDRLGIDTVVRLDEISVQSFAQVMNAKIFTVVEYDYLTATLVIDIRSFHQGGHHGIANVVGPETVAIIAQVETLDFFSFRARLEQGIF